MADKRTLYVSRRLLNADALIAWARQQGFDKPIAPDDLHVTIAFSRAVVDWESAGSVAEKVTVASGSGRRVEKLGEKGAVVLRFASADLKQRWEQLRDLGASWDHPSYKPHVTITYDGDDVDLGAIEPFDGPLEFGPEVFAPVNEDWKPKVSGDAGLALDRASARTYDADGHLHVAATNISKANVCPYFGREIPDWQSLGLSGDQTYHLLRDPDELAKAAASFNGKPLLNVHRPVTADDHEHEVVSGSVQNPVFEAPYLKADLSIWDGESIRDVERGVQRELSSAYRYRADMTPGTYDGARYDGVMRDIQANHVALVREGRAGPDVLVGDSKPIPAAPKGYFMNTSKTVLTRKAALVQGALAALIGPKMATDAKPIDLTALVKDVTAENFKGQKPAIIAAVGKATKGKLAQDADLSDVTALLDVLDDMTPEEVEEAEEDADGVAADAEPDDDDDEAKKKAKATADKKAKDTKTAKDKSPAMDTSNMVTRAAMDEAIRVSSDAAAKSAAKIATDAAIKSQRDLHEAERFVRPWVGDIVAQDSAEAVLRTAAKTLGVANADTVHIDALRPIIAAQPVPGAAPARKASVAMDAASVEGFKARFPDLKPVRSV